MFDSGEGCGDGARALAFATEWQVDSDSLSIMCLVVFLLILSILVDAVPDADEIEDENRAQICCVMRPGATSARIAARQPIFDRRR